MGIADELAKLEEMHHKGTLSDAEFEKAKASILGTSPKGTNSILPKLSETKSKVRRYVKKLITIAVIVGIAWFLLTRMVGEHGAKQLVSTVAHTPITLINEVENLEASSWIALPLNLTYNGTVNVTLEVVRGNPIDIFVIPSSELENFKNSKQFRHFTDFMARKTKSYKRSSNLTAGVYYLVLRDSTLGILSSPSSDIKVMARLEP